MTPSWSTSLLAAIALTVCAPPALARTLEVGAGKTYKQPSEAAEAAAPGDHILIDPGSYFDCAVLRADDLVIEGRGAPDAVSMTDKTCQGKAILVTTGARITVRNLTLTRARVPDGNGAGIRGEGHDLTIDHVRFINNQDGILTGDNGRLLIRDSEFVRNGACDGACAHGVYAGHLALLRIERSRFIETRIGHHIKSRAERTEVIGCDIGDGEHGTSSYLIDIPNGGAVVVRDTTLEKGPHSGNHGAAIIIGEEGVSQPTEEITITHNSFRNDGDYTTSFVYNLTATEAALRGNTLSGPVAALRGDGTVE